MPFLLYWSKINNILLIINHLIIHILLNYLFKPSPTLIHSIQHNERIYHLTLSITKYTLLIIKTSNLSSSKPSNIFKNTSKLSHFNLNKKLMPPSIKSVTKFNLNSPISTCSKLCLKNSVSTFKPKSKM